MPKISVSGVSFDGHEGVVQDGAGKLHDVNPIKAEHQGNLVPHDGPALKEEEPDVQEAKPAKSAGKNTK